MAPKPSDARRRELGAALRRWRDHAGLNGLELAKRTGYSQSTISRMESGHGTISEVAVMTYLAHCGADAPKAAEVLRLARETEDGYLVRRDVLRTIVLHETTASKIHDVAPLLIPGLLQTEAYARAVISRPRRYTEVEVDKRVAIRMDRQSLLDHWRPPRCSYFIYEAALRCPMGGDRVMNEQLLHLAFIANRPHIDIRIIPFASGGLVATTNHMSLMDFAEHGPVLYLEAQGAGLFVENAEDTERARSLLRQLADDALDEGQSREMLARLASEYDRPPEGAT